MSGGYSEKFSQRQCKIQLPRNDLREHLLGGCIFQTFKEPKIQNFGNRVPPPGYIGFITSLPFWATGWRLERMILKILSIICCWKCLNDCNVYLSLPPENIRKPYAKNWLKTVYAVFLKPVFWNRKTWKEDVILRCKNSYIIFRDLTPIGHEDIEKNKTN